MKKLTQLFLVTLLLGLISCNSRDSVNTTFKFKDKNLQLTFPGKPQKDEQKINEEFHKLRQIEYYSTDSMRFYLSLREIEYEWSDSLFAIKKEEAIRAIAKQGFTLNSVRDTFFAGVKAFHSISSKDDEILNLILVFDKNLVITLATNGPKGKAYNNQSTNFFHSFSLREEEKDV